MDLPIVVSGSWDADFESHGKDRYGSELGAFSFCAHAVEIEVDPGDRTSIKILDYAMATDSGTDHPSGACEGQIEGGLVQGIGYALTEGMMIEDGQLQNPNFSDYKIPCIKDIPPAAKRVCAVIRTDRPVRCQRGRRDFHGSGGGCNRKRRCRCHRRANTLPPDHAGKSACGASMPSMQRGERL